MGSLVKVWIERGLLKEDIALPKNQSNQILPAEEVSSRELFFIIVGNNTE